MKKDKSETTKLKEWKVQAKKNQEWAIRHQRSIEKHLETKIPITLENFSPIFEDFDNNVRLELIKSLIWTAPDSYSMWKLVCEKIANDKFGETID